MRSTRTAACALVLLAVCSAAPASDLPSGGASTLDAPRGDGRRTLGRFGSNLLRNSIGLFSTDNIKPLALGVALSAASTPFDRRTAAYFEARPRAAALGDLGQTFGGAAVMAPAVGLLFVTGRAAHGTRFRAASYDMTQAVIVAELYTGLLKASTGRLRPDGSDRRSFPSGHTSNAFALAAVTQAHYGTRAGILAYGAAALVGVSRMEKDKHHLSDVMAGAALGYAVGRTVVRQDGAPLRGSRSLALLPATDPSGRGLGVAVSLTF